MGAAYCSGSCGLGYGLGLAERCKGSRALAQLSCLRGKSSARRSRLRAFRRLLPGKAHLRGARLRAAASWGWR